MRILLKTCRVAAAAAVIIALSLLAWQCLDIYDAGRSGATDENGISLPLMYTREDVAQRLDSLSVPLAVCAGIAAVSIAVHAAWGGQHERRSAMTPENRLRLLKARVPELPEAVRKEETLRRRLTLCFGIPMGLAGLWCLVYLLNPASFPLWSEVSPDAVMGRLLLHILPPAICALVLAIGLSYGRKASLQREIALLQGLPKAEPAVSENTSSDKSRMRILLYALAAMFILLGVMNGGMRDVLYKAINICTECIGLG